MLQAIENIRAGQTAGEREKTNQASSPSQARCHHMKNSLPQSLLIFILEFFISKYFSEKPQPHSFRRNEGLVHRALSHQF